mmetsp:Transcript_120930/g.180628  ORF Transcript_120930/g.180628 Transcript_120930/m.180628 type:complete len:97 (+) Transcript_120930:850-1140(+)
MNDRVKGNFSVWSTQISFIEAYRTSSRLPESSSPVQRSDQTDARLARAQRWQRPAGWHIPEKSSLLHWRVLYLTRCGESLYSTIYQISRTPPELRL